jgi:hypothetical protein
MKSSASTRGSFASYLDPGSALAAPSACKHASIQERLHFVKHTRPSSAIERTMAWYDLGASFRLVLRLQDRFQPIQV